MIENIIEDLEHIRTTNNNETPLDKDPLLPFVETIIRAGDSRKANNICAYRVCHLTETTTFMIILEGNSRPQNQAIALAVEEDILKKFEKQILKQGSAASGWILMDYGSVIVHIMTPQMRNFYKLEKKWKDGEMVNISGWIDENNKRNTYNSENDTEMMDDDDEMIKQDVEEDDPFWK
jgi:ribosome-associated protein